MKAGVSWARGGSPHRSPARVCGPLLFTGLLLAAPILRGADPGNWYVPADQAKDGSGSCSISGNEVSIQLSAEKMRFYTAGNHAILAGDFEVIARIELSPAAAQPGCNRRANLTLVSYEPGQGSLQQVYVGVYQKTTGALVPTGGSYSLITNMVVGGKGGRFSTHPASQAAPAGLFKIVRQGEVITTYYSERDAWIPFSRWTGGFPDKLQPSFQVDNKWEAATACAASARLVYTPGTAGGGPAAQTGASAASIGEAFAGLGKFLDAAAAAGNTTSPPRTESGANKTPASGLDRALDNLNRATSALDGLLNPAAPAAGSSSVTPPPAAPAPRAAPAGATTGPGLKLPASQPREAATARAAASSRSSTPAPAPATNLPAAPAGAAAPLKLSDFEEGKWSHQASSPWAPAGTAATPLPRSWNVAPSAIAPVYDINQLTPGDYDSLVKTAMAGMRIVMGELTAEQEAAFQANWAPLFEYPCQEVLDYFRKFNPLCGQFVVAQAAFTETAKAYDRAQAELLLAASEEDADSIRSASEAMRSTKNLVLAHSNTMTAVARAINALGPLPDPLANKKRHRKIHDDAMSLLAPPPFEGEWRQVNGERFAFKVMKELQPDLWLVYTCPLTLMEQTAPGAKWFIKDFLWIVERTPDGRYLHLDATLVNYVQVLRPEGQTMEIATYQPANSFNPKPSFGTHAVTLNRRLPPELPVPGGNSWGALVALAESSATDKQRQFVKWKTGSATQYQDALRGDVDDEAKKAERAAQAAEFEAGRQQIKQERASRQAERQKTFAAEEARVRESEAQSPGQDFSAAHAADRNALAESNRGDDMEAEFAERRLRARLGMEPASGTVSSPPTTPAPAAANAAAEQAATARENEERVKFHEANLRYFDGRVAALRSDFATAKDDVARENLSAQIMMTESNLQKEKDHLAMIRTGQWVNTRTAFDDYIPPQVAEEAQDRAQIWGQANRTLEMAYRQIALAPPDDRERLLTQFNQSVALAKGDPNKVVHAGKTLFDQVQGYHEAQQGATEEDLINAEQKLAFAQNVKTVSDYSLMVVGTIATAGGGGTLLYGQLTAEAAVQNGYGIGCGYVEGGLPEAFKQAATSYSTAASIFSTAMDSYHAGVLENLRAHAEKPDEVAIDETGAGLKNATWTLASEAAKAAVMKHVVEPAAATLRRSLFPDKSSVRVTSVSGVNTPETMTKASSAPSAAKAGPAGGGEKWPTVAQRLAEAGFRAQQAEGRAKVNLFKERCETAAEARRQGAPPAEVERLRARAEEAYMAVKTDYHSKTVLKKVAELGSNPNLVRYYNFYDKKNMAGLIQEVNASLARQGIPPQQLEFISNSASGKGIGMDIDMHANDPARMLGEGRDRRPNPEYAKWRNQLVQTLPDGSKVRMSPEEFRQKTQRILTESFEQRYQRSSEQVFPTFTTKDYAEAYKDKAWLGLKGESHADFAHVQPLWAGQAADVTGFKVNSLSHEHPSLGTYTILQEQSRGILKDMDTKLFGAKSDRSKVGNETGMDITINPNGPLAKAPPPVQQHFMELRRVLRDFASNNIGPIEADQRLHELTGGRGLPEVADRLGVVLTNYKKN